MGVGKGGKRVGDEAKASQGDARRNGKQAAVADKMAVERNNRVDERQSEGKHEGEMAGFDDHFTTPALVLAVAGKACPSFQTPCCFSASATSRGM